MSFQTSKPTNSTNSNISNIHKNQIQQLEELKEFYEFEQIDKINNLINQINEHYNNGLTIAEYVFNELMNDFEDETSRIINNFDSIYINQYNGFNNSIEMDKEDEEDYKKDLLYDILSNILSKLISRLIKYMNEIQLYSIEKIEIVQNAKCEDVKTERIQYFEHLPFYQHFKGTKWLINLYSKYFECYTYDVYANNGAISEIIDILKYIDHVDGIDTNEIIEELKKYKF